MYAELNLHPVHKDESPEYSFNTRFSLDNALERLQQITDALESFRTLTKKLQSKNATTTKQESPNLKGIKHIDWGTQYLGFHNWAISVEGTLRKQEYLIKKLTYELEKEKNKSDKTNQSQLTQAYEEYIQAEQAFQNFWDHFYIAD